MLTLKQGRSELEAHNCQRLGDMQTYHAPMTTVVERRQALIAKSEWKKRLKKEKKKGHKTTTKTSIHAQQSILSTTYRHQHNHAAQQNTTSLEAATITTPDEPLTKASYCGVNYLFTPCLLAYTVNALSLFGFLSLACPSLPQSAVPLYLLVFGTTAPLIPTLVLSLLFPVLLSLFCLPRGAISSVAIPPTRQRVLSKGLPWH